MKIFYIVKFIVLKFGGVKALSSMVKTYHYSILFFDMMKVVLVDLLRILNTNKTKGWLNIA